MATKAALLSGPAPLPIVDLATMEEVSKAVIKLVDKKYIKRSPIGGFEFLVD